MSVTITRNRPTVNVTRSPNTVSVERAAREATVERTQTITRDIERTRTTTVTAAGPQGPQGVSGSGTFELTAGAGGISALRVVVSENGVARYPSITTTADAGRIVGLSYTAASAGGAITVQPDGVVNEPLWTWTPGVVWVGTDGVLTQTPPASPAWLMEAGRALSATQLLLDFQKPIIRSE